MNATVPATSGGWALHAAMNSTTTSTGTPVSAVPDTPPICVHHLTLPTVSANQDGSGPWPPTTG